MPSGERRPLTQGAPESREAQAASWGQRLEPSTRRPLPRDGDGDPTRAKVGQILAAEPAALGPTGRTGARRSVQAGVGPGIPGGRRDAKPGVALGPAG